MKLSERRSARIQWLEQPPISRHPPEALQTLALPIACVAATHSESCARPPMFLLCSYCCAMTWPWNRHRPPLPVTPRRLRRPVSRASRSASSAGSGKSAASSRSRSARPPRATLPASPISACPTLPAPVVDGERRRGRGAVSNAAGRFEPHAREAFDDGWESLDELPAFQTSVTVEKPRTIINRNNSPDVGFDRSINPYRGCEHGCVYCFARPTHAYQGYSAGLDFETKLFAKPDAPELLAKELSKPGYEPRTIALGINTDGYQPIEREWRLTRRILEVLRDFGHPVGIVTEIGAGAARPRHSRADGRARPRQGGALRHHARPQAGAHHGAARGDADAPHRDHTPPQRGRRAHRRAGGPDDPGDQRRRTGAHPRHRRGGGSDRGRLCDDPAAAGDPRSVQGVAADAFPRPLPPCAVAGEGDAWRQGI